MIRIASRTPRRGAVALCAAGAGVLVGTALQASGASPIAQLHTSGTAAPPRPGPPQQPDVRHVGQQRHHVPGPPDAQLPQTEGSWRLNLGRTSGFWGDARW
jgi:hypothetical protein